MRLLVSLLMMVFVSQAAADMRITVRPLNYVKPGMLTLGDIAEFDGIPQRETYALQGIALGNAPSYGEKRSFSNQALTEILRAHLVKLQSPKKKILLQVPNEVLVEGTGLNLTENEISSKLIENLRTHCEECQFQIEGLRLPKFPRFSPQAAWQLRADFYKLRGPFSIAIEIFEPIGEKQTFWINGRVKVQRKVPVTTRVIDLNQRLLPEDIKWVVRDVTFIQDSFPTEKEIMGAQVRISLSSDQVVSKGLLARQKALNRGEQVTVVMGNGAWSISMKGIAQEPGYVGDIVRVLNPETKKVVSGVVSARGMVEIK